MAENISLERGRRAGNILLAQTLVSAALSVALVLTDVTSTDIGSDIFAAAFAGLLNIAISFILISPLKHDRLPSVRIIYIILGCLSVVALYLNYKQGSLDTGIFSLIGISINVLVIIALYILGPAGKICCFIAAGLSLLSAFLPFTDSEFFFPDFIDSVFSVIFFIFLGAYVESKGVSVEQQTVTKEASEESYVVQPTRKKSGYDDLIKLKELMDAGVITPAEYEAKKKQILGL